MSVIDRMVMSGHQNGLHIYKAASDAFCPHANIRFLDLHQSVAHSILLYKEPFPCPIYSHTELPPEFHAPSAVFKIKIAVNISAQQLVHTDLVAEVRQALAETGASPECLELELTESAFMQEPARAVRTLHELRAMGVSIALDDFGTGYSNLTYLSRLPLDKLKIDRHFTISLLDDEADASICRSIVFLARGLNLEVVAEGVETDHQRRWLLEEGCISMQGYFFSRPVSLDAMADAMAARLEVLPGVY